MCASDSTIKFCLDACFKAWIWFILYKDADEDLTAEICLINCVLYCNVFLFVFTECRFQFWQEHLLDLIEKHHTTKSTPSFLSLHGLLLLITSYLIRASIYTPYPYIQKGNNIDKNQLAHL